LIPKKYFFNQKQKEQLDITVGGGNTHLPVFFRGKQNYNVIDNG
jgi:hypothetical protein